MVEDVIGDLFEGHAEVILHQANCHHSMASGIAKDIRERFPEAYAADLETPKGSLDKLGSYSVARIGRPGTPLRWIVNLYSQYGHRDGDRRTSYDAMYAGLEKVRDDARFAGLILAVPSRIGCGLGGGNWRVVRAILEAVFGEPGAEGSPRPRLLVFEKPAAGLMT